jgi:medium-chain acyl-[acyl-carrier-protein] hydrolase
MLRGTWVNCARAEPDAAWRLWCLPHAGGGAAVWSAWPRPFAGRAEIAALRPPGRESRLREAPLRRWRPLAEHFLAEMAPYLDRKYALVGHSLGAVLAFELARLARARGLPGPAALIVLGARAPALPRREPDLHPLPDSEFLAELDRRYEGIPPAVRSEPELLALLLPAMRADLEVFETYAYEPAPPLAAPILALGGERDPHVSGPELRAGADYTTGAFAAEQMPGGHFFLQAEAARVTTRIGQFLDATNTARPAGR